MIKLYTKTVCPKCLVAKAMLEDSGIEYEAINVEHDQEARDKVLAAGFMAAPVAEYEGKFYGNVAELINSLQDAQ